MCKNISSNFLPFIISAIVVICVIWKAFDKRFTSPEVIIKVLKPYLRKNLNCVFVLSWLISYYIDLSPNSLLLIHVHVIIQKGKLA